MIFSYSYDFIIHIPIFNVCCTYLRQTNQKESFCEIGKHVKFKKDFVHWVQRNRVHQHKGRCSYKAKKTVKTQFTKVKTLFTMYCQMSMKGIFEVIEILFTASVIDFSCYGSVTSYTRLCLNMAKFWFFIAENPWIFFSLKNITWETNFYL